jgi:hypothetical protein
MVGTSRSEDDEALLLWGGDDDAYSRLARWMIDKANPDDWHAVASTWNFDSGYLPLTWIIPYTECDKATALLLYWLSEPTYSMHYAGDFHNLPN